MATFRLAVDRSFKKDGEQAADFVTIVAWRNTAEFVSKYFTKGRMALVEGRLQIRQYTDKDGNKRTATEVVADSVNFCGDIQSNPQQTDAGDVYDAGGFREIDDDGELPF